MARYYKINTRIWWDEEFKMLSCGEKADVIKRLVFDVPPGPFERFRGPCFHVAEEGRRRPDLYSSEWRRIRKEVIEEQGTRCSYCESDCAEDPTVDHIVPVCQGGPLYEKSNLVVSCRRCNSRKGGREAHA